MPTYNYPNTIRNSNIINLFNLIQNKYNTVQVQMTYHKKRYSNTMYYSNTRSLYLKRKHNLKKYSNTITHLHHLQIHYPERIHDRGIHDRGIHHLQIHHQEILRLLRIVEIRFPSNMFHFLDLPYLSSSFNVLKMYFWIFIVQ